MGIQILNKDVSVISSVIITPKASISSILGTTGWAGGGEFAPGDFAFTDGNTGYTTNTVTFTKSGRLYIEGVASGEQESYGYLNGQQMFFWNTSADALTYPNQFNDLIGGYGDLFYFGIYGVFDVSIGDTMYFENYGSAVPFGSVGTATFRINSFRGTIIDSFTATWVGI
jgi:hypothetical protein